MSVDITAQTNGLTSRQIIDYTQSYILPFSYWFFYRPPENIRADSSEAVCDGVKEVAAKSGGNTYPERSWYFIHNATIPGKT